MHRKTVRHFDLPGHAHELTFSCVDRANLLVDDAIRMWLADSISRARKLHGFHIWAYVFMPNHVHILIFPMEVAYATNKVLQSIKQPVGRRVLNRARSIGGPGIGQEVVECALRRGRFWQDGPGYDRNVTSTRVARDIVTYIHSNPVRRGLVQQPGDWYWSSAGAWEGTSTGPLEIDRESFPT